MDKLISELGGSSARALVDRVVPALQQAYGFNAQRHAPERGDDDRLFGVAVWRTSMHELGQRCVDIPDAAILEQDICFEIEIEIEISGRTLRVYKMPPRHGNNVDAFSLTGSKVKVAQARRNDDQLVLFNDVGLGVAPSAEATTDPVFPRLIILHQGSPLDGLRWIVVGAPSADRGWHWWDKVYDASWEHGEGGGPVGTPQTPDAPKAPAHDVRLKVERLGRRSSE